MRITIIAVVALVILLAGIRYILRNFETLTAEKVEVAVPGMVVVEGLAVPVTFEGARDHTVTLDFYLEIAHGERAAETRAVLPRIRDAILRDVHRTSISQAGVGSIDLVRFKERVKAAANEVLHDEEVTGVLMARLARLAA